ncbi:MAG: PAS domain S-box protein, partial [Verrucomicrobia bacterium]|nr:PAS domain S-box protein [Verrucomicrobiota bacterium]
MQGALGSSAFLRLSGYSRAELIGKTAVELGLFVHPEQRAAVVDQLQAAEHVNSFEIQARRKDGKIIETIFSAEVIHSQGRQYVLGVSIDITEHRAAEQKLRESEARQRAITDSAQDAVLMMDPEGRISHWNPAAERILGYP